MKNIYVSSKADFLLTDYLSGTAGTVIKVEPGGATYPAVDAHPDIYMCKMGIEAHPHIFFGNRNELGEEYPLNIKFNAVCLDRYFIHRLKYTSPELLNEARRLGMALIDVRQGYTKCSCVVVDGHSVITADAGILRRLRQYPGIDVLPVRQGCVRLEGFEYGFLGGASGRVGHEVIFNGDLSVHPDYIAIRSFIEDRGLKVTYFPDYPLTDIGSIIEG